MQLHQTTTPPTPVLPRSIPAAVLGIAMLILVSACSSAGDYSTEVSAIDAGNNAPVSVADPSLGSQAETQQAETRQPETGQPDTRQPDATGDRSVPSRSTDGQARPPVLEVTGQTEARPTEGQGISGADTGADATQPSEEAESTPAPGAEAPTGSSQPAAGETPAADAASPPATAAPGADATTGQPPETDGTTTDPPVTTPPATEAPVQTAPPATDPPTAPAPAIDDALAPPKPSGQATPEPNCAVLCNIAMEGDSLTVGLGNRLCGAVQTGNCINSGIVGRRVDEMIVTARTDIDNQVGTDGNDVLILWGGTNDLWQKYHSTDPATNAAAIYEQIKTFVAERRANGWDYIYVMTLPPMNPTYVVGTDPLNGLIRENQAGADGVLDVGADPRLANAFDPAMRAADGIHFGDGGRAVVMEYVLGAIRGLDGV